ncbi:MAG: peptidylprolyl isomerase [Alphaproteobacteria bacterium]|jgi:peptidyl-prolyl cis-trans isomerase C|nr:peptidylprolyl isomerase [Alphaproteobacteria bacterium]MBT4084092.1 peptidylprolyl isomerase [Alphaproteobacteria bacterium]MBT4544893.1 peptidylprolyl isomerase [Alphaproteobacteria bacterium]MBT7745562.1 peptidylprolyl isomerase [Alphaproteobacteria bacterium]
MKTSFVALLVAMLFGTTVSLPVAAQNAPKETSKDDSGKDDVIATVNGMPVYNSEVAMLYQSLPDQYKRMPMQVLFPQLVDAIIDRKIVSQVAEKEGMLKDPTVSKRLTFTRDSILQDMYIGKYIAKVLTEDKLLKIYEEEAAKHEAEDEVHARHILLKTEDEAKAVIAELGKGGDFVELAKTKSTGPSGPRGGDLGFFEKKTMVPAFAAAAFATKVGEYTKTAVKTEFGYHVIKVEARRPGKKPTFEETMPEIRSREGQKASVALLTKLRQSAEIKRFDEKGQEIKAEPKKADTKKE